MAETLLKRLRNSQFLKDIWTNLVSNAIWKLLAILATPILIWFGFSKGGLGDGPNNGTTTVTQTVPAPSDKKRAQLKQLYQCATCPSPHYQP